MKPLLPGDETADGSFDNFADVLSISTAHLGAIHVRGASGHAAGDGSASREAYSHEVSSAGFWPGSEAFPQAAFYSYAYPEPPGFREAAVTQDATFDATLGEFILPYETVRLAADPDALLLDFLVTTYTAAADAGDWDRAALECEIGAPAQVRSL